MGKLLKKLSDRIHRRIDRPGITKEIELAIVREGHDIEREVVERIVDKVAPKYDPGKSSKKGVGGAAEGGAAGAFGLLIATYITKQLGIDDSEMRLMVTVAVTATITGAAVGLKRWYFNWQRHRHNK